MNLAILGATSAIAQETARCFAAEGASFFLVARDAAKCAIVADDLRARGAADVQTFIADLADFSRHAELAAAAPQSIDITLIAHGTLPDQNAIDDDPAAQAASFELNATSFISLAAHFANRSKTLAVIGSVAGDRGRRSNYVYGAAKAALDTYCEGLRARGTNVVFIKPGWIDTPMTSHVRKNPLFASAQTAGRLIHDAILARRAVVYVPWFWRWISLIVRMLPAKLVKF
ncbi:MAG TPA: SDR family NAD(P)-dependent oxidoreductase [Thermoanaerobaculia bacterium]|nr:SDR family NAD(P)-dependent oxidoreductase [Thermoanaerobaculia bacterium]